MKARILNTQFNGIYTDDFILNNWNKVINGQLVSEWELTENLPTEEEMKYIKLMYDGEIYFEGASLEEINIINIQKAIEIDLMYTERIYKLMAKHNDKYIEGLINGITYTIPLDVIAERERLKTECNTKINELGITDFSYRQTNLQLKK